MELAHSTFGVTFSEICHLTESDLKVGLVIHKMFPCLSKIIMAAVSLVVPLSVQVRDLYMDDIIPTVCLFAVHLKTHNLKLKYPRNNILDP